MRVLQSDILSCRFVQQCRVARNVKTLVALLCTLALIDPAMAQGGAASLRSNAGVDRVAIGLLWDGLKSVPGAILAGLAAAKLSPERSASSTPKRTIPDAATALDAGPQRVVLYEEDRAHPKGLQYGGTVVWRLEPVTKNGLPTQEIAVRGDVHIPARQMKMTLSFRKNTDATLPASHLVDLTFVLSPDSAGGDIAKVAGILMKDGEQARGTALVGLAVKVTQSFFMFGLSNDESDRKRNLELLRNRSWFDIPVVYQNRRRAIIAISVGSTGDRAFKAALDSWDSGTVDSLAR